MLRYTCGVLFHIPKTAAGAEARRVGQQHQTPSFVKAHRGRTGLRNGARDSAVGNSNTTKAFGNASGGDSASSGGSRRSTDSRSHHHHTRPGRTLRPGDPLPPQQDTASEGYTSQRQAYHRQKAEQERVQGSGAVREGVAGSYFTPLPRQYGFYDGIDEDGVAASQPTREERQAQLRAALESQAASVVDFTDGGEADIEMNGLPAEQYHGQAGWTTIPRDSALYHTMYGTGDLESRQRTNSWGVAMRKARPGEDIRDLLGESSANAVRTESDSGTKNSKEDVLDDRRRRRQHDEGFYSTALEGEMLAPTQESVGQPRSTYALRKMYVDGLVGYQGMISRAEEAAVSEELLHLLQSPRAAYVAEEARYCVNLYEKELGIPGKDTLAFALASCPTLQRVLYRFFFLGLIPSVPNVCQVSEMVGNFSGYPVHRHPRSIGSYVGLLNLVSTSVLHLRHKDSPWYPRLHLSPRSLFVVTEPCLGDYAMGYKQTQQPFHAFEYATRVSKDYRIEVLFATVETAQTRTLAEAVQLTDYATAKMKAGTRGEPLLTSSETTDQQEDTATAAAAATFAGGNTDAWLQRLRAKLHHLEEGKGEEGEMKPLDGHALRRQLLEQHLIGEVPKGMSGLQGESSSDCPTSSSSSSTATAAGKTSAAAPSSPAQRRLAALKARFEFAQSLKASKQQVEVSAEGPQLIRGYSPKDRLRGIK